MKLIALRSCGRWRKGESLDLPDGLAELRVSQGHCEKAEAASHHKAISKPRRDKFMKSRKVKDKALADV